MPRPLGEVLEEHKAAVVEDCLQVLDAEVADKSGISGLAIKASFAAVKGVKPGFIRDAVIELLPEFARALDPLFQEAHASGGPVGEFLLKNRPRVSQALLAITDAKAVLSPSAVVKGAYNRLRPAAEKNVEAAVPRLAQLIARYAHFPPVPGGVHGDTQR
jgi:hypothetical protein